MKTPALTKDCDACDGTGRIGEGPMIGPCESARSRRCEVCGGSGVVPLRCITCGQPATEIVEGEWQCAQHAAEEFPD